MRKIKAYTLMEVTIAMLLSAICIGICYSAYDIIGRYYASFQQKNEGMDEVLSFKHALHRDIGRSTAMLKVEGGVRCQGDSTAVSYLFEKEGILRQIEGLRTDTFRLAWKDLYLSFENRELLDTDTLDRIQFSLELQKGQSVPLIFSKHYSSQNLFR